MADSLFRVNRGITLNPQLSAPTSPTNGDIYYDSTLGTFVLYNNGSWVNLASRQDVASAASLTSANFTSTIVQNSLIKITGTTASTLHGLTASTDGKIVVVYNDSTQTITLAHQSVTEGTAANRIVTHTATNIAIPAKATCKLVYDAGQSRWINLADSVVVSSTLSMVGSAIGDSLDSALVKIDTDLGKLFEDRNILLTQGGFVTFTGTQVQFTEALILVVNQRTTGSAPVLINLGSTTRSVSASGRMMYAVIDRAAGTATVTDDATTLPAATSSNQEVFLIAKRIDAGDGTKRLYWSSGIAINEGQTVRLGASGGTTILNNGASLTGSYDGDVYIDGSATITGNLTIKGRLFVLNNLTNTGGYTLTVHGDCFIQGAAYFNPTSAAVGNIVVDGDLFVGQEGVLTPVSVNDSVASGGFTTTLFLNTDVQSQGVAAGFTLTVNSGVYTGQTRTVTSVLSNIVDINTAFAFPGIDGESITLSGNATIYHSMEVRPVIASGNGSIVIGGDLFASQVLASAQSTAASGTPGINLTVKGNCNLNPNFLVIETGNAMPSLDLRGRISATNGVNGGNGGVLVVGGEVKGFRIQTDGGSASTGTANGGSAGSITLGSYRGILNTDMINNVYSIFSTISAKGGTVNAGTGGNGANLNCGGDLICYSIDLSGANSTSGNGGVGGNITLRGDLTVEDTVISTGGSNTTASGNGGNGGSVAVSGNITAKDFTLSGGGGFGGGNISGNGGSISSALRSLISIRGFTSLGGTGISGASSANRGTYPAPRFSKEINYLDRNPDFETGITGFYTYADAAGTLPVDGTGGTANITFDTTSGIPLRGSNSGRIAKDAANRQGQGVSYDFNIDRADRSRPLTVTFDYEIASGTYADGDLTVYLYDIANSRVIQPSGYSISKVNFSSKHIAEFQPSTATQYRLIFHIASTSTSAWQVHIDNLRVGPQIVQYGAPVTDWVSYTPTGTWTSNATYAGKWRRVGDSMEIQAAVTVTGPPNVAFLEITGPTGYAIDTTKYADSVPIIARGVDAGSREYVLGGMIISSSPISFRVIQAESAGGAGNVSNTVPFNWDTNDAIQIRAVVPIQGWSSNVQMSDSTDTRVVAGFFNGNQSGTLTNSFNKTTFATTTNDTHAGYSSGTYTVKVPGYYDVSAVLGVTGTFTAGHRVLASVFIDGVEYARGISFVAGGSLTGVTVAPGVNAKSIKLNAGQTIDIRGYADGSSLSYANGESAYFSLSRQSGPSAIAASETVSVVATNSNGQNITSSVDTITNWTELDDSHGAFNPTTGVFTAPVSGRYRLDSAITVISSSGDTLQFYVVHSGSGRTNGTYKVARTYAGGTEQLVGGMVLAMLAGDTAYVRGYSNNTRALENVAANNHLSVVRVGNY